ncbi:MULTISPECIES: DNA-directed RNA polymerase subunit beta [Allofournierella]|uniref:DNA-directed RNA polymerase subunit beta n=2 Tax=Allofournierella TaxID=1940255 RepID=A0ABT7UR29_9FIRM|nr:MULTISPECIES: DNA-directed RNA polymerase subunit beta [Fournierella]MDM8201342.1 DNA-directed RNA polymerase subunit beta [Fournierella massiliensis]OUN16714.1 DNA-directed RNA polymerase subunit beta [Gemmiger sp. An87]
MMKVKPTTLGKTERMSFSRIDEVITMPNLIEVQKNSYRWFLDEGLKEVFRDIATIEDFTGNLALEFVDYHLGEPKYTIKECKERDTTYAAPLRVTARLLNKETGEVKEQEIFMGDFPLMTDAGTFINNGAERVIVSQLVRSPGVYFGASYDKTGKKLYTATMNPNRGAWLEYETDSNDVFYVRIDKNRKLPVTVLLRALGMGSDAQIREFFGEDERILATLDKDTTHNEEEGLLETYRKLRPGEPPTVESAQTHLNNLFFDPRRYDMSRFGRYKMNKKLALARRITGFVAARDIIAPLTGELLIAAGEKISREAAEAAEAAGVSVAFIMADDRERKVITNGTVDAQNFFNFDVLECGINERVTFAEVKAILDATSDEAEQKELLVKNHDRLISKTVTLDDIFSSINYLNGLDHGIGVTDDIDHLGNRRIRSVGELLQNQFRIGFSRMERVIRERMTLQAQDMNEATPQSLINIRPVVAAIKEFFGSSPLSQFMDQNNPLAELTHKRRLSALGPGGLSRDRAGFEVRDVHYSHYGRMCPIETPEGPNIGLISYLASFARINEYGFIEAPYRKVDKERGVVTDEVVYMTADVEDEYVVAQANEPLDEEGHFTKARVNARRRDEILEIERERVDYMDVSPKMVVSVATAMIPFLENDDANRALMGANMQRQAVPLLVTQQPIVATGMEYKAACDSGVCVLAKNDGVVEHVDADKIVIRTSKTTTDEYELIKFMRSNQGTCVNQRPIVDKGEEVKAGQVIADGPATKNGEISLGKNALIGFMTWEGYNYEDAVLINEKIVREDVYTSIHIEEYETEARETKLGPEEITRDIPNVGEDALKDLDERGIIRIGAEVKAGDILVGKVTPKGETELTAEERLLRAIFGEKAREVRDTSLRVPHGQYGIIVDVKVFTPDNCDELQPGVRQVVRCYIAQKRKISVGDKMAGRHGNKGVVSRILPQEDMPFLADGTPLDIVLNPLGVPSRMNIGQVLEVHLGYAAKALGWKIMTPVFDGAHEQDIRECYHLAYETNHGENAPEYPTKLDKIMRPEIGHVIDFSKIELDEDGKSTVYDGRTGEKFDNRVTVGYMYYLKLHHLVDDKIHARSTGPYSLVTQQPLGGKAQFGGQRFGEMEVWALEAYGAAYTLQEILTVKSDDVVGRVKTYEAIVKGQPVPKPGIPESFRVLIKELQSLGLDVRVQDSNGDEIDLKQNFDDEEPGFDTRDLPMGEDVLVENELSNDYSIEDADPDADAGFDEPEDVFEPDDSLFADDGLGLDDEF